MKLLALLALPVYFLQTVLHELAHAGVLLASGAKPRISLLPSKTDHGFRFASTTAPVDAWTLPAIIAPRVVNLIQVFGLSLCHRQAGFLSDLALVFTFAALVDFLVNSAGIFRAYHRCDAWDTWSQAGGGPTSLLLWRIVTAGVVLGLWVFALWAWAK